MRKTIVALLASLVLAVSCSGNEPAGRDAAADTCASLHGRWNAAAAGSEEARRVQGEYEGLGCYGSCGELSGPMSCGAPGTTATSALGQPPVTAPPFPTRLTGYAPDGTPSTASVRVYSEDEGSLVPDFPATMNGCGNGLSTTRWRSVGGPVTAGIISYVDEGAHLRDATKLETGVAGLVTTDNQCEQPVFFGASGGLVDVAIEYLAWRAAP